MNRIEITYKQINNLKEMIKELYPDDRVLISAKFNVVFFTRLNGLTGIAIHWYEFTMTSLAKEIFKRFEQNFSTINYEEEIKSFALEAHLYYLGEKRATHPIDYLYSQFKESTRCRNKINN